MIRPVKESIYLEYILNTEMNSDAKFCFVVAITPWQ